MDIHNSIICISVSGYLESDCEVRTDKNGHNYIRFRILCPTKDSMGKPTEIPFRCFSYNLNFSHLKKNDVVFVIGDFKFNKFKEKFNFDIYAQQIFYSGPSK